MKWIKFEKYFIFILALIGIAVMIVGTITGDIKWLI